MNLNTYQLTAVAYLRRHGLEQNEDRMNDLADMLERRYDEGVRYGERHNMAGVVERTEEAGC